MEKKATLRNRPKVLSYCTRLLTKTWYNAFIGDRYNIKVPCKRTYITLFNYTKKSIKMFYLIVKYLLYICILYKEQMRMMKRKYKKKDKVIISLRYNVLGFMEKQFLF